MTNHKYLMVCKNDRCFILCHLLHVLREEPLAGTVWCFYLLAQTNPAKRWHRQGEAKQSWHFLHRHTVAERWFPPTSKTESSAGTQHTQRKAKPYEVQPLNVHTHRAESVLQSSGGWVVMILICVTWRINEGPCGVVESQVARNTRRQTLVVQGNC